MLGPSKTYSHNENRWFRQTANVMTLDRQDEKLQLAQTVGADFTVNTSKYHIS